MSKTPSGPDISSVILVTLINVDRILGVVRTTTCRFYCCLSWEVRSCQSEFRGPYMIYLFYFYLIWCISHHSCKQAHRRRSHQKYYFQKTNTIRFKQGLLIPFWSNQFFLSYWKAGEGIVRHVSKSAFCYLHFTLKLAPFLDTDDLTMLISVIITSVLYYCNTFYIGLPLKTVWKLQLVGLILYSALYLYCLFLPAQSLIAEKGRL